MHSYQCDQGHHQDCDGSIPASGKRKPPTRCGCPCHRPRVKAPTPTPDVVKTPHQ